MTYDDITAVMDSIGLPYAYDHFAEGESPDLPFFVFLFPGTDNFIADGEVYQQITNLTLELYTRVKDPIVETRVETMLRLHDIVWNKTEVWIDSEQMYEVRYALQVMYDTADEETSQDKDVG